MTSKASQLVDLFDLRAPIGAGLARFTLSGWMGGFTDQTDTATLRATFLDALGNPISGSAFVQTPPPGQRGTGNQTGLYFRAVDGVVPQGAAAVEILLTMEHLGGRINDGNVDNVSFVVTQVPEPTTAVLLALGVLLLLARRRVRAA